MRNFKSLKLYVAGNGDDDGLILEADTLDTPKGQVALYQRSKGNSSEDRGEPIGVFHLSDLMDALVAIDRAAIYDDTKKKD